MEDAHLILRFHKLLKFGEKCLLLAFSGGSCL